MIPESIPSSSPQYSDWLYDYPTAYDPLVAYEWGGVAIEDVSQGLGSHLWELTYDSDTGDVKRNRVGQLAQTVFNAANLVRLGLSFDQNMHPCYVWESGVDGYVNLIFYDVSVGAEATLQITGITSPCITLDDKRRDAADTSDIIFAYIRDGNIYYRQQRDRFTIERVLGSVNPTEIITRIGMSQGGRLLMELQGIAP